MAVELRSLLDTIKSPRPALSRRLPPGMAKLVKWVERKLLAKVNYRGSTADRLLRHVSFQRLRASKKTPAMGPGLRSFVHSKAGAFP